MATEAVQQNGWAFVVDTPRLTVYHIPEIRPEEHIWTDSERTNVLSSVAVNWLVSLTVIIRVWLPLGVHEIGMT